MTNETRKRLQRTPRTPITDRIRTIERAQVEAWWTQYQRTQVEAWMTPFLEDALDALERAQVEAWLTQFIKDTLDVYPENSK